jgi:hypothetical protein
MDCYIVEVTAYVESGDAFGWMQFNDLFIYKYLKEMGSGRETMQLIGTWVPPTLKF